MTPLENVHVHTLPPERFEAVLDEQQWLMLDAANRHAREIFGARVIWSVNSTASGGGVAEMLQSLIAYARGAGVDARWVVIEGEPEFFTITKRLHHHFHGSPGDGGPLGAAEREVYRRVTEANARRLAEELTPGDVLLLHDPQTAGMVPLLSQRDVHVVWRSHIGIDRANEQVRRAWDFLLEDLADAQAFIFTRREYVPPELRQRDVTIIPPSIDVFSEKNQPMTAEQVTAILVTAGIVAGEATAPPVFLHHDGREDSVRRHAEMDEDERIAPGDRLVVQVSRWDPLKDPIGVMRGFAAHVAPAAPDARLVLAGPSPAGVTDDPEGVLVLEQVRRERLTLPEDVRRRVHLASLPMESRSENAAIVNALQRHAAIVVQKSLAEGFGLTVAEAMWKHRPVVASRVGGIQDQIIHGETGIVLDDPADLVAYGAAVTELLSDPARAERMGEAAHERVRAEFLGARHLIQYLGLFARLIEFDGWAESEPGTATV